MPTDPALTSAGALDAGLRVEISAPSAEPAAPESLASEGVAARVEPPLAMRVAVGATATIVIVAALWAGKGLLMPIAFAVVLTLLMTPAVTFLNRFGVPRWLGAAVMVALAIGIVGVGVLQLSAPAEQWLNPRSPEWRKLETQLRAIKQPLSAIQGAQERVSELTGPAVDARRVHLARLKPAPASQLSTASGSTGLTRCASNPARRDDSRSLSRP